MPKKHYTLGPFINYVGRTKKSKNVNNKSRLIDYQTKLFRNVMFGSHNEKIQ